METTIVHWGMYLDNGKWKLLFDFFWSFGSSSVPAGRLEVLSLAVIL